MEKSEVSAESRGKTMYSPLSSKYPQSIVLTFQAGTN